MTPKIPFMYRKENMKNAWRKFAPVLEPFSFLFTLL